MGRLPGREGEPSARTSSKGHPDCQRAPHGRERAARRRAGGPGPRGCSLSKVPAAPVACSAPVGGPRMIGLLGAPSSACADFARLPPKTGQVRARQWVVNSGLPRWSPAGCASAPVPWRAGAASPVPSPAFERIRRRSGPGRHFPTEVRAGDLDRSSSTAREGSAEMGRRYGEGAGGW
jgi:hypothetical protein